MSLAGSEPPAFLFPAWTFVNERSALPYWWMLSGAFFFSVMVVLSHALREFLPWQTIALVRTSLALVLAVGMTLAGGASLVFFRPAVLWMRSLAGSLSLVLTFYALTHTRSLAEVLVLSNMFPIWVALLSGPMLGNWPRTETWLAIVCGLAGVILIQRPASGTLDLGLLAAAVGSFSTAFAMLGLHRLKHLDPRAIVAHFSAVGSVFCLGAMLLLPMSAAGGAAWDWSTLAMLGGVGITATIGQLFLTKAFAAGPPAKVSVVGLSQVAFSVAADMLFWHRSFEPLSIAGMLLIVAPTAWLLVSGSSAADVGKGLSPAK